MGVALTINKGLPGVSIVSVAQTVQEIQNTGSTVIPFAYTWPGYVFETAPGGYQSRFAIDPALYSRAVLESVLITMPPGIPPSMAPEIDTVLRLERAASGIDFTLPLAATQAHFIASNTVDLPWTFWQGNSNDPVPNLDLIVKSSGNSSSGTRAHQLVTITANIRLTLR